MRIKLVLLLALMLTLSACAASRGHRTLTGYLDSSIGTRTFEDVVKRWHRPDEVIKGEGTLTGIWIREDYIDANIVRRSFSAAPSVFGEKKTLIFDQKSRLLKSYIIEYY